MDSVGGRGYYDGKPHRGHPMTAPSKMAEELARGLFNCLSRDRYLTEKEHDRIVAALREYGAAVRARDAEICRDDGYGQDGHLCANEIEGEPLP